MVILAPALNYTGAACQTDNCVREMSTASVSGMHVAAHACEVDYQHNAQGLFQYENAFLIFTFFVL